MNYTEEAAVFPCEGRSLIGVLARPEVPQDIGMVVIVGAPNVPQPSFKNRRTSNDTSLVALMSGEPSRSTSPAKKP